MSWQDCYATEGDPFGQKREGTNDHRGQDYKGQWRGRAIVAYEHGVVALVAYSSILGFYIVVKLDDGLYAGWAHTIDGSRLGVGTEVWAGTIIAQAAGSQDRPGSAWFGPHIHTTLGPRVDSIYTGTVYDPAPRIRAARRGSSTAGGTTKPLTPEEQDDDMPIPYLVRRVTDGDPTLNGMTCAMAPGYFIHLGSGELEGIARDLKIPADKIVAGQDGKGLPAIEFVRLLSLFQIPPGYVRPGGIYIK